jgi:hypothetical protein
LVITRGIWEEEEEAMKQAPAHMAKYQHKKEEEEDMKFSYKIQTQRKRKKEDLQFSYKVAKQNKRKKRYESLLHMSFS